MFSTPYFRTSYSFDVLFHAASPYFISIIQHSQPASFSKASHFLRPVHCKRGDFAQVQFNYSASPGPHAITVGIIWWKVPTISSCKGSLVFGEVSQIYQPVPGMLFAMCELPVRRWNLDPRVIRHLTLFGRWFKQSSLQCPLRYWIG